MRLLQIKQLNWLVKAKKENNMLDQTVSILHKMIKLSRSKLELLFDCFDFRAIVLSLAEG